MEVLGEIVDHFVCLRSGAKFPLDFEVDRWDEVDELIGPIGPQHCATVDASFTESRDHFSCLDGCANHDVGDLYRWTGHRIDLRHSLQPQWKLDPGDLSLPKFSLFVVVDVPLKEVVVSQQILRTVMEAL